MKKNNRYFFPDYPDFTPNLSPSEIFQLGSFGGTYWRPIQSSILKKNKTVNLSNRHKLLPKSYWENIDDSKLTSSKYQKKVNKYNVNVGLSLEEWENYGWIKKHDPYGWMEWYAHFFNGRRISKEYDEFQIGRWKGVAGPKGRFKKWLVTLILKKKDGEYNDYNISPKIRQTLQHWGYKLTKKDFDQEVNSRKQV